jgi:hypothetical protein
MANSDNLNHRCPEGVQEADRTVHKLPGNGWVVASWNDWEGQWDAPTNHIDRQSATRTHLWGLTLESLGAHVYASRSSARRAARRFFNDWVPSRSIPGFIVTWPPLEMPMAQAGAPGTQMALPDTDPSSDHPVSVGCP